jgi:hypothetical protein
MSDIWNIAPNIGQEVIFKKYVLANKNHTFLWFKSQVLMASHILDTKKGIEKMIFTTKCNQKAEKMSDNRNITVLICV